MNHSRVILGIDPGLRHTGWGLIKQTNNRLSFVAAGRINPAVDLPMAYRLLALNESVRDLIDLHNPDEAAIEETFVNKNARSALLLGQARGSVIVALAERGLGVAEYAANKIKQSLTGYGHAEKTQIQAMVLMLLPESGKQSFDAADALAVAITHAHSTHILAKTL